MVNVQYTHDDIDQQLDKPLDEVKKLPQNVTLHYCLKTEYLTQKDLEIARTDEYKKLIKKYGYLEALEYANLVFKQIKLSLYLTSTICTFCGFYYALSYIFILERVQNFTHYVFILFLIISAGYYYLSITILEIKMAQAWRNRLLNSGRLLFPYELTNGLFYKYTFSAIISQIMILFIFDASVTFLFST